VILRKMKTHTKNILRVTAFLLGFAFLLSESHAQLITSETFSGLTGTGLTGSDSSGWSDSGWNGGSDSRFSVINPTTRLSYQITGGALLNGGNGALQLTTSPEPDPAGLMAYRSFTNYNTTIYMSWLMRISSAGTGSDTLSVDLLNGTNVIHSISYIANAGGLANMGSGAIGPTGNFTGVAINAGTTITHLIVVEFTPSGPNYNTVNVWLDPSYNSYSSTQLRSQESSSGVGALGLGTLNGIGFGVYSTDLGGPTTTALFDSLKIGYTWGDVVPLAVPEPSSYALFWLGSLVLVIAYWRKGIFSIFRNK